MASSVIELQTALNEASIAYSQTSQASIKEKVELQAELRSTKSYLDAAREETRNLAAELARVQTELATSRVQLSETRKAREATEFSLSPELRLLLLLSAYNQLRSPSHPTD